MTTERPDRGARALAERLPGAVNFNFLPPRVVVDPIWAELAAAILANGAVFLPDAALAAAFAEALLTYDPPDPIPAGGWSRLMPNSDEARRILLALRAALEPEGSAPDGG